MFRSLFVAVLKYLSSFFVGERHKCRSQWPRGLRRGSAAARLLGLWVRIPPGSWMSVSCECSVVSGTGLCFGLITHPEESYRVWCVWAWSWILDNEEALAHWELLRRDKKKDVNVEYNSFIYSVFCLTTGPKAPPKRCLYIVRSRASSFKWEYPLLSLRSSSSFLRLLPRLLATSISPFIFPSINCFRRQFLRKMCPIQLAFRFLISCRIFLCSLTLSNTSSFLTWSVQLILYKIKYSKPLAV